MDGIVTAFIKPQRLLFIFLFSLIGHHVYSQKSEDQLTSTTWENTLREKKGQIIVYWNTIKPFVYKNANNEFTGIEVDLLKGFQEYLLAQYDIKLEIKWVELRSFNDVYTKITNNEDNGAFGLASFSVVEERKKQLNFSPIYLRDVSVIVSNSLVPSSKSQAEFLRTIKALKAVTLENSTYEKNLYELRFAQNTDFEIEYINSTDELVDLLASQENVFGYLELPNYIAGLNEGLNIKRHNFFPVAREGYAITYPLQSDWGEPISAYFNRVAFMYKKDQIVSKYLGVDVLNLIQQIDTKDTLSSVNEIGLLTKEKEIQQNELIKAELKDQRQSFLRNLLLIGLLFIIIVSGVLYYNNRQKTKTFKLLLQQQQQIQEQQNAIAKQNESLESSNKELVKLNQQKNDLIGILSHDLRAPINQIKGFAEIYKIENKDLHPGQADLIDRIISTSDRLTVMIRKIMDVEAVESNKVDIKVERINLSKLLREVAISFENLAKGKKIKIDAEIEVEEMHVEADKIFLTQVFENLVSNAIKFSDPNKTVKIQLLPSDDKVMTKIKDQGPGLTKEDQKKLFNKYQKLSAKPTDGEQSTGLGLSIVKKYVEKMNGKVWAESNKGEGSTFIVQFDKVA